MLIQGYLIEILYVLTIWGGRLYESYYRTVDYLGVPSQAMEYTVADSDQPSGSIEECRSISHACLRS